MAVAIDLLARTFADIPDHRPKVATLQSPTVFGSVPTNLSVPPEPFRTLRLYREAP